MTATVDVALHVTATLAAVVAVGTVLGRALRAVGQPAVIGEMLAGILLGPSLLGWVWPDAMHALIPGPAADPHGRVPAALQVVAQLGVVLYMFLVGLDRDAPQLSGRAGTAVSVSFGSTAVAFGLGAGLAVFLYPVYGHSDVPFTSFALFLGVALSITAFPVLARILTDRRLEKTDLGTVALGCAAVDNLTAWCLLALVVGVVRAEVGDAARVVGGAAALLAVMLLVVRPLAGRAARSLDARPGPLPAGAVAATFVGVLMAALAAEGVGIHAMFGAFLLGAVLPHDGRLAREFAAKVKEPVTVLLLPAFFAYSGLRTEIGLLSGWQDWLWCAVVILAATAGKFGGALLAARLTGMRWRQALPLGALMNTRGLMELIVLNIGLDLGVIGPTVFAMMVLMALATTAATAPLLTLLLTAETVGVKGKESAAA